MLSAKDILAFHGAVVEGDQAKVERYIGEGIDLDAKSLDRNAYTALHWAAQEDNEAIARVLLDADADPNIRSGSATGRATPLVLCSAHGSASVARALLEHGADPNIPNKFRWSPLHNASDYGFLSIVELLTAHGANLEARNERRCTPLHCAAYKNQAEVCKHLLEHGADVNAKALFQRTPLMFASRWGERTPLTELLVSHGAQQRMDFASGMRAIGDFLLLTVNFALGCALWTWPLLVWHEWVRSLPPLPISLISLYALGVVICQFRRVFF